MWSNIKALPDDNVTKFIFTKPDAVAEAVLYRYPDYATRTVICCSVMSGCPIGCRFCGSGDYFVRNLTADEIVAQVEHCLDIVYDGGEGPYIWDIEKLQIMFMSMGEPMLNQRALVDALHKLHASYPSAQLLVSTSAPRVSIREFMEAAKSIQTVGLQFSIHESTDVVRDSLIPFKNKFTLQQIAFMGHDFYCETGRRPFINYCAHDNNSYNEDADRLAALFDPRIFNATVSVVCERSEGVSASNEHQRALAVEFAAKLVDRGFDVRMFDPAGQDTVGGGCGQLWYVQDWMRNNPEMARPTCGNGLGVVHAPTAA